MKHGCRPYSQSHGQGSAGAAGEQLTGGLYIIEIGLIDSTTIGTTAETLQRTETNICAKKSVT